MNRNPSKKQCPPASRGVRAEHPPVKADVWQETKSQLADAYLDTLRHGLIIIPVIVLSGLMWLARQAGVSPEVQSLLEFGDFLVVLIQLSKLVGHLIPESISKDMKEFINRKYQSWIPDSKDPKVVEKVK